MISKIDWLEMHKNLGPKYSYAYAVNGVETNVFTYCKDYDYPKKILVYIQDRYGNIKQFEYFTKKQFIMWLNDKNLKLPSYLLNKIPVGLIEKDILTLNW